MDLGNTVGSVFTGQPVPHMIDVENNIDYLKTLININRAKMFLANRVRAKIKENRRYMRKLLFKAMNKIRVVPAYILKMRIANSEAFIHLINRYLLLLCRDYLALLTQLEGPLSIPLHNAFQRNQERILASPPNIHTHLIWGDWYRDSAVQGVEEPWLFREGRYRLNRMSNTLYFASSSERRNLDDTGGQEMRRATSVAPGVANRGGPSWVVAEEMEVPRINSVQQAARLIESMQIDRLEESRNN